MNNGIAIWAAMDAWNEFAAKHNFENPLWKTIKMVEKYTKHNPDGSFTVLAENEYDPIDKDLVEQWEHDKYAYMRARDRFMVCWLAENEDWDTAYECAKMWDNEWNDLLWYFKKHYNPCDFSECNIFCKHFERCVKDGFFEWN